MTNVANNETFEAKMKTRIRDSIGDLISDEELSKLITGEISKVFLEDRKVQATNPYGSNTYKESLVHEIVKELLTENVIKIIRQYVNANNDKIEIKIKEVFEQNIGELMIKSIGSIFRSDMLTVESNILNKLRNNAY